jgi:hypothetical protein
MKLSAIAFALSLASSALAADAPRYLRGTAVEFVSQGIIVQGARSYAPVAGSLQAVGGGGGVASGARDSQVTGRILLLDYPNAAKLADNDEIEAAVVEAGVVSIGTRRFHAWRYAGKSTAAPSANQSKDSWIDSLPPRSAAGFRAARSNSLFEFRSWLALWRPYLRDPVLAHVELELLKKLRQELQTNLTPSDRQSISRESGMIYAALKARAAADPELKSLLAEPER